MANELARIETYFENADIKKKFESVLGRKAPGFTASVISAVQQNRDLMACEPGSVVAAAMVAASLDLPIVPSLGFAYIVPYNNRAQFQIGWKGLVQLGLRTGHYKNINVSEMYKDELKFWNPITGDIEFHPIENWKMRYVGDPGNIVGYVAFFRLLNGFEKYWYMTTREVEIHGQKYSKSYNNPSSQWRTNFVGMAKKTDLKQLLGKFGIMSTEMQRAIQTDQAVVNEDGSLEYVDNGNVIKGTAEEARPMPQAASAKPAEAGPAKPAQAPAGDEDPGEQGADPAQDKPVSKSGAPLTSIKDLLAIDQACVVAAVRGTLAEVGSHITPTQKTAHDYTIKNDGVVVKLSSWGKFKVCINDKVDAIGVTVSKTKAGTMIYSAKALELVEIGMG